MPNTRIVESDDDSFRVLVEWFHMRGKDMCTDRMPKQLVSSPYWISRKASGGVIHLWGLLMPAEPPFKRSFVFIDGQNLFYAVKQAFGYSYPNYDPLALAQWVCQQRGWQLTETHFYTGLPQVKDSAFWNYFWMAKLAVMGTRGIKTFSRHLKYRNQTVYLPGGKTTTVLVGQEKGVDVRLALDVVRFAREDKYDVAVIFSPGSRSF